MAQILWKCQDISIPFIVLLSETAQEQGTCPWVAGLPFTLLPEDFIQTYWIFYPPTCQKVKCFFPEPSTRYRPAFTHSDVAAKEAYRPNENKNCSVFLFPAAKTCYLAQTPFHLVPITCYTDLAFRLFHLPKNNHKQETKNIPFWRIYRHLTAHPQATNCFKKNLLRTSPERLCPVRVSRESPAPRGPKTETFRQRFLLDRFKQNQNRIFTGEFSGSKQHSQKTENLKHALQLPTSKGLEHKEWSTSSKITF